MKMDATIKPAQTLDVRGMQCPMPIVKTKKAIGNVAVGEILEVLSSDIASKEDFPRWCDRTGHKLVQVVDEEGYSRFFIERRS